MRNEYHLNVYGAVVTGGGRGECGGVRWEPATTFYEMGHSHL